MTKLTKLQQGFLERTRLSIKQNSSLEFLPQWLEDNTAHPVKSSDKWSFEGHEFQVEIASSTSHRQSIIKCSQVGLSELAARKAVALGALRQGIQIIYTLQSGSFAQMFAKTRVDPIIEGSKMLNALADKDTNNTKLKKIGTSFIHFVGTYSASAPISIPASYVISDEVDFSNQDILSEFASRMGHQKESESANVRFSTPTIDGYSISADFEKSSQGRYAVRCEKCEKWQMPNFLQDVVIPNCDVPVNELTRFDVAAMPRDVQMGAYLACPSCGKDLTNSLLDKERRMWIHAYPDRRAYHEGFKVVPFDVPSVNPVGRTIGQMMEYTRPASWYNFKLGETFSDSTSKFDLDIVDRNTRLIGDQLASGLVMGVDVGKTQSWVSIGLPQGSPLTGDIEGLQIIRFEVLDSTKSDKSLGEMIVTLAHQYQVCVLVCDAAPDFTTAQYLTKTLVSGQAYGNYYTTSNAFKKEMSYYKVDDRKGVCMSDRTGTLDDLCHMVNKGMVGFPACDEMPRVKKHLDSVKRLSGVGKMDEAGDGGRWVTRSGADDHWAHSLNYLMIAAQITNQGGIGRFLSLAPDVKKQKLRGGVNFRL